MVRSILEGVTRASVIAIAEDLGIEVIYGDIPREMLYICDEVFMSGTAAEVTPVTSVSWKASEPMNGRAT